MTIRVISALVAIVFSYCFTTASFAADPVKIETAPKWGLGGQLLGGIIGCKGGIPALEVLP